MIVFKRILASLLLAVALTAKAQYNPIIDPTNRIDWVPGESVGVRGGIPVVSAIFTNFYTSNTVSQINAGIAACPSNQVVMLPDTTGVYDISGGLLIDKSGVVLRGGGSNTLLYGHIIVGHPALQTAQSISVPVTYGGNKGGTNCGVLFTTNQFGDAISVGDAFNVSGWWSDTNATFPVLSVVGYKHTIFQPIVVTAITGTNLTFWPPLAFDFTNSPILEALSQFNTASSRMRSKIGLENLTIVSTNAGNSDNQTFEIICSMVRDSWFTNVNLLYPNNYCLDVEECIGVQIDGCSFQKALSQGTSHAGLLLSSDSANLIQNNIFSDLTQLGMMFNEGFCGNAVFANYFISNTVNGDVLMHNTHPVMNLFEANVFQDRFVMDGYFGSSSHQTLFRNYHPGSIAYKRNTTYMQTVGNVMGTFGFTTLYIQPTNGFNSSWPIFDLGFPNIGNQSYITSSPPVSFTYPGDWMGDYNTSLPITNGIFTFTNNFGPTNQLWSYMGRGTFTNIPSPNSSNYPLKFQDGNNTNLYWPQDGSIVLSQSAGTSSNILLQSTITVSNGWTLYIAGQIAYQWYEPSNIYTHNLHGNLVYTNAIGTVVWDANNANHALPNSLLYTNGAPSWWGTNRWPAIDPTNAAPVAKIPAQVRYETGFSPGSAVVTSTIFGSGSTISSGNGSKLYFGQ